MDDCIYIRVRYERDDSYAYVMPALRRNTENDLVPVLTRNKDEARVFKSVSEADMFLRVFRDDLPKSARILKTNETAPSRISIPTTKKRPVRENHVLGEPMGPENADENNN